MTVILKNPATLIYRAGDICIEAVADLIKTSTAMLQLNLHKFPDSPGLKKLEKYPN
ncbi:MULTISPECIES: hypothetical protein [unclassified Endozoicomonas]|uniref:hypothetical protein n=1 Tax=unclassified Endozoicomonas TaxID=2644528 RepID=UPI002147F232|nr:MULTISPECIES: hypothetical protein [unclassified Endozoicomonas]